jgi:hypothetical protein
MTRRWFFSLIGAAISGKALPWTPPGGWRDGSFVFVPARNSWRHMPLTILPVLGNRALNRVSGGLA